MCGLIGVILANAERSEGELETFRELVTSMLLFHEERGREASGLALIWEDGTVAMFKRALPPSRLVKEPGYRDLLARLDNRTAFVLGHTRRPTKGSPVRNDNNHPIRTLHTVGVHNGTITNDDELGREFNLPRTAEVDSEIIFRLLDRVPPDRRAGVCLPAQYCATARLLSGTFSALAVDLRDPNRLVAFKRGNPLCYHRDEPLRAVFLASRYLFLRRAFGRAVLTEALAPEHVHCFNREGIDGLDHEFLSSAPIWNGSDR